VRPDEIPIGHLSNTSQKRHHYFKPISQYENMYFNYPSVDIHVMKQNADFLITNTEAYNTER